MKTRISGLLIIPLLLLGLAACSSGVPQEELDAVNALLQEEQAKSSDLENRLKKAAHLEAARGLLADGWELPGAAVLALGAAVQASDDTAIKASLSDLVQSFLSGLDSLPPELVGEALAAVQGSGDLQVAEKLQGFLFAAASGSGGGVELLEVAQAVQDSDSQPLKQVIGNILETLLRAQEGVPDLAQAIADIASASTDPAVQQALQNLGLPPDEFVQQVQEQLEAAGVPALQDGFREAYLAPGGNPSAFYDRVVGQQRQALGLPATEAPQ